MIGKLSGRVQRIARKQMVRQSARGAYVPRRSLLLEEITEIISEVSEVEEDDSPDDEDYPWLSDPEGDTALSGTALEYLDYASRMYPQTCHILISEDGVIRILSSLSFSSYADAIIHDVQTWFQNNRTDSGHVLIPGTRIGLDFLADSRKYSELKKNCRELKILLPDLSVVPLLDIYRFAHTRNLEIQQQKIAAELADIYRQCEPFGDFSDVSALYRDRVLSIKGVKGHTGDFSLYITAVKRFMELYHLLAHRGVHFADFRERFSEMGGDKARAFLETYGESLWERLGTKE